MPTTINSYSVSLGLNANDYIKNSALSRSETNLLKKSISEAKSPVERYAGTYDLLEKALAKGAISLGTYKRLLDEARSKVAQFGEQVRQSTREITTQTTALGRVAAGYASVKSQLTQLNGLIATYVGFATAKKAVGLAVDAEQAGVAFEVLTGSVDDSLVLMRELRLLAEKSPITFSGAQTAARTLLSFNVATQDVLPTLKRLSDVVGGNNERFKMISLAFAQMSAAGRLLGQDLLQMVNAGFNPLQTISKITGESLLELKKRMGDGRISSEEVANALTVATSEGGKFYGMTDRLAKTIGGRLNIAMSDLEKSLIRIGKILGPLVADMASGFSSSTKSAGPLLSVIQKIVDGLRLIGAFSADIATLTSDIFSKAFGGKGSGRDDAASNFNAFMIEYLQRPAKAAALAAQEKNAKMSERAGERKKKATLEETEILKEATKLAEKKSKAAETEAKKIEDATKKAKEKLEVERKSLELDQMKDALKNAQKHFEGQRTLQAKRFAERRAMKISSLEVGSEGAASYLQSNRNNQMFGRQEAMSTLANPTNKELLLEAKKQLEEIKKTNAKQDLMVTSLRTLVVESKQNGFRRFR